MIQQEQIYPVLAIIVRDLEALYYPIVDNHYRYVYPGTTFAFLINPSRNGWPNHRAEHDASY
jgi:hypothetical protein